MAITHAKMGRFMKKRGMERLLMNRSQEPGFRMKN
jgi:hypothetical protein